jgi:beta-mannosidase
MTPWPGPAARERIAEGWEICSTAAGAFAEPDQLVALATSTWVEAPTLGPAADVLRSVGIWRLDGPERHFDAEDWWYRATFEVPTLDADDELWLGFDGLATVADVWLNGRHLLHSTSMFVAHARSVGAWVRPGPNQLVLRFHALDAVLAAKRPRPRWRAPMVAHQQLRWLRTTLLGRTPGWSPPAAVVGPFKDIWWEHRRGVRVASKTLQAHLAADGAPVRALIA